jgi:serine phosphatase RsbU (regulator of sigma subunit)/anti-sigma regulatory factor (Ser/Thr protein kinase)
MDSATFPADSKNLVQISEFVRAYAQKLTLTLKQIYEIDLAVDEASSNIIDHAYKNLPQGKISIFLSHTESEMKIILQDDGVGFDLDSVPKPDLDGPLEDRRERGLGIFLIHQLMDQVIYEPNTGNGNQLTLIKKFPLTQQENVNKRDNSSLPLETLRIISDINRSISSTLDLDELLQEVTRSIHTQFGYPLVHIFLLDFVSQMIVFKAGSGLKADFYEENQIAYPVQAKPGLIPLTTRSRKVQLSNDISTDPNYRPDSNHDTMQGSELSLPLQFQGEMLGVLDIQSDKPNAFSDQDVEQLEILSQSISIALRNANLYKTSQWHRNLVERYRETAERISRNVEPEELICYVIEQIPMILPVDFIGFWKKSEDQDGLILNDYWCREPEVCQLTPNQTVKADVWFAQVSSRDNGSIKPVDVLTDPVQIGMNMPPDFSAVASSISYQEQEYGVLTFHAGSAGRYGQDSVNICSTFADYIGTALDKQRVEAEKDKQAWLTSILLDLAIETKNLTSLDDLTNKIGQILIELIGGVAVGLVLETENHDTLSLPNLHCPQILCPMASLPLNFDRNALIGSTDQTPQLSVARAGEFPELLLLLPQLTENGTILTFPLQTKDQTLGYLLHLSNDPFTPAEPEQVLDKDRFSILKGISQQAAISLQNIQMLEDKREEYRISLRLLELGNVLQQTEAFDTALNDACMRVITECNLSGLALLAYQQEEQNYKLHDLIVRGDEKDYVKGKAGNLFSKNEMEQILELIVDQEDHALSDNMFCKLSELELELHPRHRIKTLVFPIEIGDEFYGFLLACDEEHNFIRRRQDFLTRASSQIALAFQNYRMQSIEQQRSQTEQELNLARRIQKTFLPEKLPQIPGYQLAVAWQTARQVGGDFYDIIPLDDGRFGLIIADVSDKGLPASLYMTVSRTLLRAVSRDFTSPARTLERVNQLLQLDSTQSFFVTLIYMILDKNSGKLTYAIAGHNPPYILDSAQKAAKQLPKGGIALGLLEPITLTDVDFQLEHGQSIVLYTDGVSEPTNTEGQEYGQERLPRFLKSIAELEPEKVISELQNDLEVFQGGDFFEDDRTLLVLKRT